MKFERHWCIAWVVILYFSSYVVFSRAAYRKADAANAEGFYFVFPSSTATAFANDLCFAIYWPLVQMDMLLGTGRPRASDPLRLSLRQSQPLGPEPRRAGTAALLPSSTGTLGHFSRFTAASDFAPRYGERRRSNRLDHLEYVDCVSWI